MAYIFYLLLFLALLGLVGIASNPSLKLAALSLIVAAGAGCGVLAFFGKSFLSLVLFLVYLGGVLVLFSYCVAFATSFNLKNLGGSKLNLAAVYALGVFVAALYFMGEWGEEFVALGSEVNDVGLMPDVVEGVSLLFSVGWALLIMGASALLLVLMMILVFFRDNISWSLRKN